ncbi:gliotoxin biosynthesis [Pyrrhoderma noxium]|uniref:gamma-glutamylcyclotransferase n=1 Tax=Pyrrhoderma noxium TaxID=2282107 RepID=A0A286U5H2_9AGAM|nr:gliotoxin biosynthesis [Pyrrhoderma noxium]
MDNLADSELVLSSPTSTRKNAVILAAAIAQNHASLETGSELKHEERTGICSTLGLDPKTESGKEDPVWYLAYGSNLNPKVFEGRRGIKPLEKRNVLVPGLELTFDLAGFPYFEPRFANTRLCKDTDTTVETFVNDGAVGHVDRGPILATEGGGSTYEMVAIDAYELSQDCENPCGEEKGIKLRTQGDTFKVFTLLAPEEKTRKSKGYSSQRYLTLIRDGAKVNNLPKVYLDYLYTLKPYSIVNFRQKGSFMVVST